MKSLRILSVAIVACVLVAVVGCKRKQEPPKPVSQDWPEWGGRPMRNMYSVEKGLPDSFGKIDFKPGTEEIATNGIKNLRWTAKIGSQSYGNVTVAGGRAFIG